MRRRLNFILGFNLLVMAGSCQKTPIEQPKQPVVPTFSTNLEIVWDALFHSDGEGDYYWDKVFAGQYVILANRYDDEDKPRGIGVYHKLTGERHPAWKNDPGGIFAPGEFESLKSCMAAGKNKDIILIYSGHDLFAYGLHSGQRMWKLSIPNTGQVKISAEGDNAFIIHGIWKSWSRLAMVDVYSGKKTDILELYAEDNYQFEINPPSAYVTNEGDTLLYFTTDAYNFETNHSRGYAYCYNLTKKQMLWVNKELTITSDMAASASNPPPFVIENDKLIITTRKAIGCFNKNTGELLWQREGLSFAGMQPLYRDGRLYIRYGNPCFLLCLDAQSGQQIWNNTSVDVLPRPDGAMDIYKDRLYMSAWGPDETGDLVCVDIHTGNILWTDGSSYGNISFGVLIDQETGYLYCNTFWATLCVDLNKTPNGKRNKVK